MVLLHLDMAFQGDSIYWVEVGKIVPNPFQPRKEFNEDRLKELSESIRMYGILQPLTVTRNEIQSDDGAFYTEYELIAGERRLRASKLAGLEQVPVIIRSGEDTEQEKLELAIIENLQREDLNAVDRALAFKQLAEVFKLSHAQVGKKVGRSREYVSNSIRLLNLPDCILNSLSLGDISEGHARTLLMLKDRPEEQDVVYREILLKKLSVREVERIARKIATDKVRKKKWTNTDAHLIEIEREFINTLGTRVQIAKTDFGGKVTIDYFSDDDLQKLLTLMQQQGKTIDGNDSVRTEEQAPDEHGSRTVIHEMSPEASLLAKLSTTTPLEIIDDAPEVSLVPESVSEVSPVSEDVQHEIVAVPQEAPPAVERDAKSELEALLKIVDDTPAQPIVEEETVVEVVAVTQPPAPTPPPPSPPTPPTPPTPITPPVREETPEVPTQEIPSESFGTANGYLQSQGIAPNAVSSSSLVPSAEQDRPTPAVLEPEQVVTPDMEAAPAVTQAAESHESHSPIVTEIPPSELLEKIAPQSDPSAVLAQSAAENLTQAVTASEAPKDSTKDDNDEALYSMKNFSL